jgi:hypothetical protein
LKSVSVGRLKDLENEGWKISPADKNAVKEKVASNNAAVAIAVSLENIRSTIESIKIPENTDIESLLDKHYKLVSDLLASLEKPVFIPKRMKVVRTKSTSGIGFIDYVDVKEI